MDAKHMQREHGRSENDACCDLAPGQPLSIVHCPHLTGQRTDPLAIVCTRRGDHVNAGNHLHTPGSCDTLRLGALVCTSCGSSTASGL
eukprot:366301-Chlamydomonas_euryale.AAC.31